MEPMTARERILAAFNRQPLDRIPTDIWATNEVWDKLRQYFGASADILASLHIDGIDSVNAIYTGPALPVMPVGESIDYWGMRYREVQYPAGNYMEQVYYPLAEARSYLDLEKYQWPQTTWFDYSQLAAAAIQARKRRAVMCGYMAPFYFHNKLRGLEQSLIDPLEDPEFTHAILQKISDFFYEHHRQMFAAAPGLIDVAQVTDDYGSQTGPLISLDIFRRFYRPHLQRFIDLCREFGIKVFHHDDGSMRLFLPDLVAMGIEILNPLQWTCPGMDLLELKRDFGDKLCFHGGVDNQQILPFGTPAEVRAEVRRCIDALASDGTGYILAPCHNIQAVTPIENIMAMYDEAWHYGRF
ncbi:uroporphyrinogen-III decarboxylase-like protein [candidate division KSB1 bacterium]|nr:uroporphyrinogen-III decarboxylase-like protein [candidate division KSB1 bacterium]